MAHAVTRAADQEMGNLLGGRPGGAAGGQSPKPERSRSNFFVPQSDWYQGEISGEDRANFIRKVYGILGFQMAITCSICSASMFIPAVQKFMFGLMHMPMMSWMCMIPAIYILCALQKKKSEYPLNYQLLIAFTLLMTIPIAGICAVYQAAGKGFLIFEAFAITMVAFGSLSLYALWSKKDFSWMGGALFMGLNMLLMFGFLGWLFGFSGGIFYPLCGAILFCGFILYDTSRILKVYGPDDAIVASIELYLDILNLFLYILEMLGNGNDDN